MTTVNGLSERCFTADIEGIGLLPDLRKDSRSDIHVIRLKDMLTGERYFFFDEFEDRVNAEWMEEAEDAEYKQGDLAEGVKWMEECELLVMHNISGFDAIALEKTLGFKRDHFAKSDNDMGFPFKTCDTLTLSQLLNPERRLPPVAYMQGMGNIGPHTLESFGMRMGREKPHHEDWSRLTLEMLHRCAEDVELGEWTFFYLMKEWDEQIKRVHPVTKLTLAEAYYVELRIAFTMARQSERGFALDVAYISSLVKELDEKIAETADNFRPKMPQRLKMQKLGEEKIETNAREAVGLAMQLGAETTGAYEYENYMLNGNQRASASATYWSITTKKGQYVKNIAKYIPAAVGFMQDHVKPPVAGPFTPLVWEDIPLGNRDEVKQILFQNGWRGVNYNDTELEFMEENDGELPYEWSGKIDADSIEAWEKSGSEIPEWCKGIAEWYVLTSRRTQLVNAKDEQHFREKGCWPRQTTGRKECRGILPRSRCFDLDVPFTYDAQNYFELHGVWPTSGHWRVSAGAFSIGTNTYRMRHKVVVNIPTRGLYGHEMRKCFIAGPGKLMIGADGSGLELRMLAHFMDDAEYTKTLLEADIHTYNQEKASLPGNSTMSPRDMAKKFIYMWLYGSGVPNLARTIGLPPHVMEACVDAFLASLPKLDALITNVKAAAKKFGYLLAVDSRRGRIRSKGKVIAEHTALNVLLQMTGSLVMKWAHVFAEDLLVEEGHLSAIEDFPIVVHQHDEFQGEVDESEVEYIQYRIPMDGWKAEEKRQHVDEAGRIWSAPANLKEHATETELLISRAYHPVGDAYCRSLVKAGEFLKLNCPTAGEYKIGASWGDTH